MPLTTVYFVRHGESVANAGGVTMEHAAIPLSPLGRVQADTLASTFDVQPSRVLVSPFLRAQETARPFCDRLGCRFELHPLLHEFCAIDSARLVGMTGIERRPIANAYWQAADPTAREGAQAETFLEFDARVSAFLAELDALPDRTVLFGHGQWFALLCWKLFGFASADSAGMKAFRRFQLGFPMPNAAVYALEQLMPGQWRVQTWPRAWPA